MKILHILINLFIITLSYESYAADRIPDCEITSSLKNIKYKHTQNHSGISALSESGSARINENIYRLDYLTSQELEPDCKFRVYASLLIASLYHEAAPDKQQMKYMVAKNRQYTVAVITYGLKHMPYYADYTNAGQNLSDSVDDSILNEISLMLLNEYLDNPLSSKSFQVNNIARLHTMHQVQGDVIKRLENTLKLIEHGKAGDIRPDIDSAVSILEILQHADTRHNKPDLSWLYKQLESDFHFYDSEASSHYQLDMTEEQIKESARRTLDKFISSYGRDATHVQLPVFWNEY